MTSPLQSIDITLRVPPELAGRRLDQAASELITEYSRSRLQQWIREGALRVDGEIKKPKEKVFGNETITISAELAPEGAWQGEKDIEFAVVYQDDDLLVINKPAGLVVHPAAGNYSGTLLNGLLENWPELESIPRAGIVHRLDKDTTGLMVVAKNLPAHTSLVRQLQQRKVKREYEAVAVGVMTGGGTVDQPVGRHPAQRIRMAVVKNGKPAVTHYRVLQRFRQHTHIRVSLETGRTHQIRVHLSSIGYPLVGDSLYAGRFKTPAKVTDELLQQLNLFDRQALHAASLGLTHPRIGEYLEWLAPLPDDMQRLLAALRADASGISR